jgi:hypothetical protein
LEVTINPNNGKVNRREKVRILKIAAQGIECCVSRKELQIRFVEQRWDKKMGNSTPEIAFKKA